MNVRYIEVRVSRPAEVTAEMLRAVPAGGWLWFEGMSLDVEGHIRALGAQLGTSVPVDLPRGTIWPKQRIRGLRFDQGGRELFVQLLNGFAAPEVCTHLHVYEDGTWMLSWYDYPDGTLQIEVGCSAGSLADLVRSQR